MAEKETEELSTEQILSSIREMLLEGESKTQPQNSKKDEVLELTPNMVIKPKVVPVRKVSFNSEEAARNIIKSFAKNFASVKETRSVQCGNNEDELLKASISRAVEDWVLKNVKSDFEFQKTVKEEVAKQVNVWFDANFVDLVNSSIKQELERVMAKVDDAR